MSLAATDQCRVGDPRELDEGTLLDAQHEDPGACRALLDQYEKRVYAFLWRMLVPKQGKAVVDELCQETFLRVFAHLAEFKTSGAARLSTWVLTIAARLALNQLRRKELEAPLHELEDQPGSSCTERLAARRELATAVAAALAKLPAEQRSVLVLREYHDLDYSEIAEALSLEIGTVRSRLSRARRRLRAQLAQYLPDGDS